MLKFTSLVSVLALPDLLFSAQMIYARTYETSPLLVVATIWYLVLTTVLTLLEHAIERRLEDRPSPSWRELASRLLPGRQFARQRGGAVS
jgi:polar amino acid transport system permease protein